MEYFTDLIADIFSLVTYAYNGLAENIGTYLGFYAALTAFFAACCIVIDVAYFVGVKK